jgi:regulator of sigma E protease
MELFELLISSISKFLSYGLPFLFVLGVVILVHELGHFWAGRMVGVRILTFSMGFGPEIWHRIDKRGTRWRLAAFPLGGYVKFFGDEDASSKTDASAIKAMSEADRKVSFPGQSIAARAWIVFAGPFANFVFTILVFAIVAMTYGKTVYSTRAGEIKPASAAEAAGIRKGDLILSVDGKPVSTFSELQRIVTVSPDKPLKLSIEREEGKAPIDLMVTPKLQEIVTPMGKQKVGLLGVLRSTDPRDMSHNRLDPASAMVAGVQDTWVIIEGSFNYLLRMVSGQENTDQLSGPIRIAKISGEVAEQGFMQLVQLAALLSVSIGFINLLPIPVLDGGHLVMYAYEAIRGKPMNENVQEWGFRVGFALIVLLMIFATWNDITHLIS